MPLSCLSDGLSTHPKDVGLRPYKYYRAERERILAFFTREPACSVPAESFDQEQGDLTKLLVALIITLPAYALYPLLSALL